MTVRGRAGLALAAMAASVGCTHQDILASSSTLEAHRDQILGQGSATVTDTDGSDVIVHADDEVELLSNGESLPMKLRAALTKCPAHAEGTGLCGFPDVDRVVVGHRTSLDTDGVPVPAIVIGGVAIVGAATACVIKCEPRTRDLVLITGGATLLVGALAWWISRTPLAKAGQSQQQW